MPFESQDSKIKAFSVPLKPAGFSPSAVVYGAGLCFVTCTEGRVLMSTVVSWSCISAFSTPLHLKWGILLTGRWIFLNLALIFQCGFPVCSEDLLCRECFSSLCFVWKKDFINFPTQALCSCPFPTSFATSTRLEVYPQLELSWISWWVPALASPQGKTQ